MALTMGLVSSVAAVDAAHALDVNSAERAFSRRPKAATALKLAKAHLAAGHVGEAMNWAESAAGCNDANPSVLRAVQRMRASQKWRLNDLGFGLVKLDVNPGGGLVRLDDRVFRPVRSHYELWLKSGTHHLSIELPDHKTVDRIVTAARGEVRNVRIKMAITRLPQLHVEVLPRNAEVWVDNKRLGGVATKSFSIPEGGHIVEIRAHGYYPWTRTVRLRLGDILPLKMELDKITADKRDPRIASQVKRNLTSLELAKRGGHSHQTTRTGGSRDPAQMKVQRPSDSDGPAVPNASDSPQALPESSKPSDSGATPDDVEAENDPVESGSTDGGVESGATGGDSGGTGDSGAVIRGGARRNVGKGKWLTVGGLIAAAGGVGWTLINVSDAYYANSLRPGHSAFDSYYANVQTFTYASYSVLAAGGILTGLGGYYLLTDGGATRSGKGWYFATTGLLAAGAGGYLMFDAAAQVTTVVADYGAGDPRRDAALDGLYATHNAGLIAAGVGGAVAAFGAYLIATGGRSRSAGLTSTDSDSSASVSLAPRFAPGGGALDLNIRF